MQEPIFQKNDRNSGGRRIAFHNLGCKVNSYETEAMLRQMMERGYDIVPFEPGADIYVINTCTVTNIADRKSRQMLHRAKAMNPAALVVAVGCYAQVQGEALLEDESVDLVIGNDEKASLPERIEEYLSGCAGSFFVRDISRSESFEELPCGGYSEKTRAFIKIEDGCNQFCSYCLIPYARGRVRSRSRGAILEEARRLADEGFREIVLTGIHLASFGSDEASDAGLRNDYGQPLGELLTLLDNIDGISRIRLGSLEPRIITPSYARALAGIKKLCPHFHLSLQSGSDTVLKRMNRHYTAQAFYEEMEMLREAFDDPALTTDVIVGFPGETEEEFEETLRFLEKASFYQTHIFRYSRRKGTPADTMPGQIPEALKAKRGERLAALNAVNKRLFEERLTGSVKEVLLEERDASDPSCWLGHTPEYVMLKVAAPEASSGDIIRIRVEKEMLIK